MRDIFCGRIFQNSIRSGSVGQLLLKGNILSSESPESSYSQVPKNLLNGEELYENIILEFEKYLGLGSFRAPPKGLLLNIPLTRSSLLWSFIFSTSHFLLEYLFIKAAGLQGWNFIKRRLRHRCFLMNIAKYLRTTLYRENLRWLLLKVLRKVCLFRVC